MAAGPRDLPELVQRFTQDVYMCVYTQPDYGRLWHVWLDNFIAAPCFFRLLLINCVVVFYVIIIIYLGIAQALVILCACL